MKNNDNKQPSVEGENSNAKYFSKWQKYFVAAFFVVVWVMLAFYESALLERIDAQSLFLYDTLFFKEMMSVPAGLLSYVGAFFTQFFAIPVAGATIFVALLFALYKTVKRVFSVSDSNSLWALLPSVLLLALNVQFGYWIFYIKFPGWYFVPLLGTLFSLFAIECYRKLSWKFSLPIISLLAIFGYPLFGVYALFAALCMSVAGIADAVKAGNNKLLIFKGIAPAVLAVILSVAVPYAWYYVYQSVIIEFMYTAGLPGYSWDPRREFTSTILTYWLPYMLLFVSLLLYSALCTRLNGEGKSLRKTITMLVVALLSVAFVWFYWYKDCNFRIENKQNNAMWECRWRDVADYAKEADVPTRTIVLNKNIALLNLGTAGSEMFSYPDGSAEIDAPFNVHLTLTCSMMTYFNYGKLNFSYRWCIENSVEYGWRVEFLKHAVRSMIAQQEYVLAERYIKILKKTLFHRAWAEKQEKFLNKPEMISRSPEYIVPLQMCCYPDMLEVDDSFVEVYLIKSLTNGALRNAPQVYDEAVLTATLTRRDKTLFWEALAAYLSGRKITRLPKHYQEAVLLYSTIDRSVDASRIPIDNSARVRFNEFFKLTKRYQGMSEEEMARYFVDDFSDTYWYYYFFVRGLKSN